MGGGASKSHGRGRSSTSPAAVATDHAPLRASRSRSSSNTVKDAAAHGVTKDKRVGSKRTLEKEIKTNDAPPKRHTSRGEPSRQGSANNSAHGEREKAPEGYVAVEGDCSECRTYHGANVFCESCSLLFCSSCSDTVHNAAVNALVSRHNPIKFMPQGFQTIASVFQGVVPSACAKCTKKPVVMYCSMCNSFFCNECFKEVHGGHNLLQRHTGTPCASLLKAKAVALRSSVSSPGLEKGPDANSHPVRRSHSVDDVHTTTRQPKHRKQAQSADKSRSSVTFHTQKGNSLTHLRGANLPTIQTNPPGSAPTSPTEQFGNFSFQRSLSDYPIDGPTSPHKVRISESLRLIQKSPRLRQPSPPVAAKPPSPPVSAKPPSPSLSAETPTRESFPGLADLPSSKPPPLPLVAKPPDPEPSPLPPLAGPTTPPDVAERKKLTADSRSAADSSVRWAPLEPPPRRPRLAALPAPNDTNTQVAHLISAVQAPVSQVHLLVAELESQLTQQGVEYWRSASEGGTQTLFYIMDELESVLFLLRLHDIPFPLPQATLALATAQLRDGHLHVPGVPSPPGEKPNSDISRLQDSFQLLKGDNNEEDLDDEDDEEEDEAPVPATFPMHVRVNSQEHVSPPTESRRIKISKSPPTPPDQDRLLLGAARNSGDFASPAELLRRLDFLEKNMRHLSELLGYTEELACLPDPDLEEEGELGPWLPGLQQTQNLLDELLVMEHEANFSCHLWPGGPVDELLLAIMQQTFSVLRALMGQRDDQSVDLVSELTTPITGRNVAGRNVAGGDTGAAPRPASLNYPSGLARFRLPIALTGPVQGVAFLKRTVKSLALLLEDPNVEDWLPSSAEAPSLAADSIRYVWGMLDSLHSQRKGDTQSRQKETWLSLLGQAPTNYRPCSFAGLHRAQRCLHLLQQLQETRCTPARRSRAGLFLLHAHDLLTTQLRMLLVARAGGGQGLADFLAMQRLREQLLQLTALPAPEQLWLGPSSFEVAHFLMEAALLGWTLLVRLRSIGVVSSSSSSPSSSSSSSSSSPSPPWLQPLHELQSITVRLKRSPTAGANTNPQADVSDDWQTELERFIEPDLIRAQLHVLDVIAALAGSTAEPAASSAGQLWPSSLLQAEQQAKEMARAPRLALDAYQDLLHCYDSLETFFREPPLPETGTATHTPTWSPCGRGSSAVRQAVATPLKLLLILAQQHQEHSSSQSASAAREGKSVAFLDKAMNLLECLPRPEKSGDRQLWCWSPRVKPAQVGQIGNAAASRTSEEDKQGLGGQLGQLSQAAEALGALGLCLAARTSSAIP